MMKRILALLVLCTLTGSLLSINGCGDENKKPPKTTSEKLDSDDPDERKEGLKEAVKKHGGGA